MAFHRPAPAARCAARRPWSSVWRSPCHRGPSGSLTPPSRRRGPARSSNDAPTTRSSKPSPLKSACWPAPGAGAVNVLYGSAAGLTGAGSQVFTQDSPGVPGTAEHDDLFGGALAADN
jgi:hypothetical protein